MKYRVYVHTGARAFGSKKLPYGTYSWYWLAWVIANMASMYHDLKEPVYFWNGDEWEDAQLDIWWEIAYLPKENVDEQCK